MERQLWRAPNYNNINLLDLDLSELKQNVLKKRFQVLKEQGSPLKLPHLKDAVNNNLMPNYYLLLNIQSAPLNSIRSWSSYGKVRLSLIGHVILLLKNL